MTSVLQIGAGGAAPGVSEDKRPALRGRRGFLLWFTFGRSGKTGSFYTFRYCFEERVLPALGAGRAAFARFQVVQVRQVWRVQQLFERGKGVQNCVKARFYGEEQADRLGLVEQAADQEHLTSVQVQQVVLTRGTGVGGLAHFDVADDSRAESAQIWLDRRRYPVVGSDKNSRGRASGKETGKKRIKILRHNYTARWRGSPYQKKFSMPSGQVQAGARKAVRAGLRVLLPL